MMLLEKIHIGSDISNGVVRLVVGKVDDSSEGLGWDSGVEDCD